MKQSTLALLLLSSSAFSVEITQSGRYSVACDGVEVDEHNTYRKALETSLNTGGDCVITAPNYRVTVEQCEAIEPKPRGTKLTWEAPTSRTDGKSLASDEIDHYQLYLGLNENDLMKSSVTKETSLLVDMPAGVFYWAISTVDINGIEGPISEVIKNVVAGR